MPSDIDNQVSSIKNRTGSTACFWDGPNQTGNFLQVGAGGSLANLALNGHPGGGTWNDRISSLSWYPCCVGLAADDDGVVGQKVTNGVVTPMIPSC